MCKKKVCNSCGKYTWAGWGLHIDQALQGIDEQDRCPGWKIGECIEMKHSKACKLCQQGTDAQEPRARHRAHVIVKFNFLLDSLNETNYLACSCSKISLNQYNGEQKKTFHSPAKKKKSLVLKKLHCYLKYFCLAPWKRQTKRFFFPSEVASVKKKKIFCN
jgi:hypothetical protein